MEQDLSALPALQPATRVRYGVLGFACALSMITYLDRACFGTALSHLVTELGLNGEADLLWAITAFNISYALFEVPSGWLGDVYGPRKTLIRIVLWWSTFTALTAIVGLPVGQGMIIGIGALILIRFLFGMGEAGAYPNITRALHNWFPLAQRGTAQGAVWFSGRLMGGLTPLVWMVLVDKLDLTWRGAFWIFGVVGVLWCIGFASWFRNRPEEKPEVNAAERALIQKDRHDIAAGHARVPWLRLLGSVNLWALCFMYFLASYAWYFNLTYLHPYMERRFQVQRGQWDVAIYKGGPLWLGAVGCLAGGWLTEFIIRRTGNRKWGRRSLGVVGHGLCSLCFLACTMAPNLFTFFLAISLAAFFNDLTMGSSWATCQDIGRRYSAVVAGCMNTIGNLGGAVAGWLTGTILKLSVADYASTHGLNADTLTDAQRTAGLLEGYQICFVSFAVACGLAVLLWLRVDATQPVVPEES